MFALAARMKFLKYFGALPLSKLDFNFLFKKSSLRKAESTARLAQDASKNKSMHFLSLAQMRYSNVCTLTRSWFVNLLPTYVESCPSARAERLSTSLSCARASQKLHVCLFETDVHNVLLRQSAELLYNGIP